jgi:hypothetical protein
MFGDQATPNNDAADDAPLARCRGGPVREIQGADEVARLLSEETAELDRRVSAGSAGHQSPVLGQEAELATLAVRLETCLRNQDEIQQKVVRLRREARQRFKLMEESLERLRASVETPSGPYTRIPLPSISNPPDNSELTSGYDQLRHRFVQLIQDVTPQGAMIAVASKGDETLTQIPERRGEHFPRGGNGGYAGFYPADSADAVAQLEALRGDGVDFLALPSSAFWWLDHYGEFASYLEHRYCQLVRSDDTGVVFDLRQASETWNRQPAPLPGSTGRGKLTPGGVEVGNPSRQADAGGTIYRPIADRIFDAACRVTDVGTRIILISPGYDDLIERLSTSGRPVLPLPSARDGRRQSFPRDGVTAVAQFEYARAQGGRVLVIPRTQHWWLQQYPRLQMEIQFRCTSTLLLDDACTIIQLSPHEANHSLTKEQAPTSDEIGQADAADLDAAPAYDRLVKRVKAALLGSIPNGASVLVVSKGDEALLDCNGLRMAHFPQQEDGRYQGYYPADSDSTIEQLKSLERQGAQFLVFPWTALWWLEHYTGLRQYLRKETVIHARIRGVCIVFDLRGSSATSDRHRGKTRSLIQTTLAGWFRR